LDLFDVDNLRAAGFPDGPLVQRLSDNDMVFYYLTDPAVFARGQAIEVVRVDNGEVAAMDVLQDGLRERMITTGVTVEVNPSSNLLIGDLLDLENHPMARLLPTPGDNQDDTKNRPVNICIGSDDPITFATSLLEEYELVYDALIRAGVSELKSREWIDRVRCIGMNARFTLPLGMRGADNRARWETLTRKLDGTRLFRNP